MSPKPFIISLIDDDEIYQFTFKKILETTKYAKKVLVFSDGEQAINFLVDNIANSSEELPDVIFLDINMPIMDGFQFMEAYIKLKPKVGKKIIIYMVSSSIDPADVEKANQISELTDYIVKPIEMHQLEEIITQLEKEHRT